MRILLINEVCGVTSTGKICTDIAVQLEKEGHECKIAYGRLYVPEKYQRFAYRIGNDWDVRLHGIKARLLDSCGFGSKKATESFIEWVKGYDPDVIHLHNLHGYYIHIGILFDYLRICGKRIVWTLHDCWAYTGHCAYYSFADCRKWINGCQNCSQEKNYPACIGIGKAEKNYKKKKKIFTGISNLIIVTPSKWLAGEVKKSFLKEYPVRVIPNGIDLTVFSPCKGEIKKKYGLENKKVLLGVANVWEERKGLKDYIALSSMLPESYRIVLIGLNKAQIAALPQEIIGLEKTDSPQELAMWYSAAEVLLNLTYEDNYPTVNLEAQACGTPVITYAAGGSPESVPDENVDEVGNLDGVVQKLKMPLKVAGAGNFSKDEAALQYLRLMV